MITLSDIDGLKDVEIAGRLGVSLATVKIRLHRARGLLRKAMEARCDLSLQSGLSGSTFGWNPPVPPGTNSPPLS